MLKFIAIVFTIFIIIGCGGGESLSSKDNNSSNTTIKSIKVRNILIDSPIKGVEYSCGSLRDVTNKNGEFFCLKNTIVTFKIGGVILGSTFLENNKTAFITPAKLYKLDNANITDIRLINFIRLVQSLDSDDNVSNGIDINKSVRETLKNVNLDISDKNITRIELEKVVKKVGKTLIPQYKALHHYINTLKNVLKVKFKEEPYYYQQWYIDKNITFYNKNDINPDANIHTNDLLKIYTGKGIKIAIIDDGLDINHEDLKNAIVKSYDIATHSSNVAPNNFDDFHGTAVAGIIGARVNGKGIEGIASQAQIIFLKYRENMSDSETIELFNKAQEFGADIINCSWGTYDVSPAVKEKIVDLAKNGRDGRGVIIVFAVGNDNQDMGNDESAIPEVIAVGATDKDNLRAWYSNYGKNLDVMAPGGYDIGITTLDPMGENGIADIDENYILYNDSNLFAGTSASAPIVSAVIALMLEKNPNLTREEVENILKNSSDKIGNIPYEKGRNNYYGYGKINLLKILSIGVRR